MIGGGPAGLKAAHALVKAGARGHAARERAGAGGLASSFDVQGARIERYYHFICRGDDDLLDTLAELGLEHRLHWKRSRMAYFVDGRALPVPDARWSCCASGRSPFIDRAAGPGLALKLAQRMHEDGPGAADGHPSG